MEEIDSDKLLARLEKMGPSISKHAKAKSERVYIDQYRKSLKAILMSQAQAKGVKTVSEREQYAYSHADYLDLLNGLRCAVEAEEKCRWSLERLKIEFEMWRTINANERFQKDKV